MDDLTEFASARLDEDEANARAALALWPDTHFTVAPGSLVIVQFHRKHDPARVLREVAAKRAIMAEHEPGFPAVARQEPPGPSTVTDPDGIISTFPYCLTCDQDAPCVTLEALAAVWSDHPDYRAEWAP